MKGCAGLLKPPNKKAPRECWARPRGRLARFGRGRIKRATTVPSYEQRHSTATLGNYSHDCAH